MKLLTVSALTIFSLGCTLSTKIDFIYHRNTQHGMTYVAPLFSKISLVEDNENHVEIKFSESIPSKLADPMIVECYFQRPNTAGLMDLAIIAPIGEYTFASNPPIKSGEAGLVQRSPVEWKYLRKINATWSGNRLVLNASLEKDAKLHLIIVRYQPKQKGDANSLWSGSVVCVVKFDPNIRSIGIPAHPFGSK